MIHVIAGPIMPDASELPAPPPTPKSPPADLELMALHAAIQVDRGATHEEALETLRMLDAFDETRDMRARQHAGRARAAAARAETAQVIAVKTPRRRKRAS